MWSDSLQARAAAMRSKPIRRMPPHIGRILELVAANHGVSVQYMLQKGNQPNRVAARREASVELRKLRLSYPQIGQLFGLHHSCIVYYCRGKRHKAGVSVLPCDVMTGIDESGAWAI